MATGFLGYQMVYKVLGSWVLYIYIYIYMSHSLGVGILAAWAQEASTVLCYVSSGFCLQAALLATCELQGRGNPIREDLPCRVPDRDLLYSC